MPNVPYTGYRRTEARRRQIMDLALKDVYPGARKLYKAIYDVIKKDGYGVAGYSQQLRNALKYVERAEIAINALEGNQ